MQHSRPKPRAKKMVEPDDDEMEESAQVLDAKGGLSALYLIYIALTSSS